jgi:hypothetical protein
LKKFTLFNLAILFSLVLFTSCSNELDLTEGKVDIPVIYGILSPNDTAHYIRVERAFSDPEISAIELAQNPDFLYYEDIEVSLTNIQTGQKFILQKVDGNLEGYVREEGAFAQSPNYLYKIRQADINIQPKQEYRLSVKISEEKTVQAQTRIVEPAFMSVPSPATSVMDFDFVQPNQMRWNPGENGTIFSAFFNIHIREIFPGAVVRDTIVRWNVIRNTELNINQYSGANFYTVIADNLDANRLATRFFRSIDLIHTSGGPEIFDFRRVSLANLGITSSEEIPTFSNIEGARGLFSSKASITIKGMNISPRSFDSLRNSQITRDLNFN